MINSLSKEQMVIKSLTKEQVQILKKQSNRKIYYYKNLILDLTNFDHPGGNSFIHRDQQQDLTIGFDKIDHSLNAKRMIEMYCIGVVAGRQNQKTIQQMLDNQEIKLHKKIIGKINFKQPILSQVEQFTKQQLLVFLKYPNFLSNDQKHIPLLIDPFLDFVRQQNIFYNMPYFAILFILLLLKSIQICQNRSDIFMGLFLLSLSTFVIWPLLQYYFHRFPLHAEQRFKDNPTPQQIRLVIKGHGIHHAYPNYRHWIVLDFHTLTAKLILAFLLIYFTLGLFFALFLVSGIIFGVILYDSLHYFFHFGWEPTFKPVAFLRQSHLKHHYKNPERGFGVSSLLWDYIFGTMHKEKKIL